jgi:hypothetical protein
MEKEVLFRYDQNCSWKILIGRCHFGNEIITCLNPLNAEFNPICNFLVLLGDLTYVGPCFVSIFQFIYKQDARLHSLFISGNCSTCFGWYFHPSSGAHTTVSTASGICHTVTAICRYLGRVGTGLSVLWVAYATNTRYAYKCQML